MPFCVGLNYSDIRPHWRQAEEAEARRAADAADAAAHEQWGAAAAAARRAGRPPPAPLVFPPKAVQPDWSEPYEIVSWAANAHLKDFESTLYTRFLFDVRYSP